MRLAALALIAVAAHAAAEPERPPVALDVDDSVGPCVADVEAVRRIVLLELGAEPAIDEGATRVELSCGDDRVVTVRVDDPITRKRTERRVELADLPPAARPRLLALAIAETVASSWVELEMKTQPALAPVALAPARDRAAAIARARLVDRPARDPARTFGVAAIARMFGGGGLVTAGARVDGGWALTPRLSIAVDVAVESGHRSIDAGDVRATLFSAAPRLELHARPGPIELSLAAGFRVGVADLTGQPRMATLHATGFLAPWGGPAASLEGRATLAGPVGIAVGVEAAAVTLSVTADVAGVPAARLRDAWAAAWLAIRYTP